jgi:thiol-disulfide isomerase/thioredoxin
MKKLSFVLLLLSVTMFSFAQQIPKWKITDYEKYISSSKDEVLVVNFWATFCKPCVAEIPSFIKTVEKYKADKVKLMLVSLDLKSEYPAKIASFAKKHHFNTNLAWLNETNADYFCPKVDVKWSGSIPSTIFINTKTGYRNFFEGEMTLEEFEKELAAAIKG